MNLDRALAIIAHGESNSLKDLAEAGQLVASRLESAENQALSEKLEQLTRQLTDAEKEKQKWISVYRVQSRTVEQNLKQSQTLLSEMRFAQAERDIIKHMSKNPELISVLRIPGEVRLPEGACQAYSQGWNDCRIEMLKIKNLDAAIDSARGTK